MSDEHDSPTHLPVDLVPIDQVTTHPDNPRRGNVAAIRSRLQRYGQYSPLVAQRSTGHILVGNHRHMAARELGWTHLNVHWLDCTDEQARRILLDDNRSSDQADYDERALAELLAQLEPVGDTLDDTLYTLEDLATLENNLTGTDTPTSDPNDSGHEETYKSRFELVIECRDETHQQDLYDRLTTEGLTCRVLSL